MSTRITLLGILLIGCADLGPGDLGTGDLGSGAASLYEISADDLPLDSYDSGAWQAVPAGCEDRLPESVTFEVADGANGLLVAVDSAGHAVCADTAAAIAAELSDEGREEEADDFSAAVVVTFGSNLEDEPEDVDFDPSADDPSPQPSCPNPDTQQMRRSMTPDDGESQPGDPSPQPS